MKGKTTMQRESKKRGREVTEEKKRSEKCGKKMHQKNTTHSADGELEEVVGVFDFPWIKDGTMFSTAISEDEWYFEGTFLSSLRAAIEDEGEFFSQFSCSAAAAGGGGLMLEFLPDEIGDNFNGDESSSSSSSSSSVPNVENSIWASVLNQPLGRV